MSTFLNTSETAPADVPAFDKEEWIRQKREDRETAFSWIAQMAELLPMDPDRLRDYLNLQSRFPRYSIGNILLLCAQRPDALRLLDAAAWKEAGAFIRKGEAGILILEPGNEYTRPDGTTGVYYNTKKVFDFSQTTANEIPNKRPYYDSRQMLQALFTGTPVQVQFMEGDAPEGGAAVYDSANNEVLVYRDRDWQKVFRETAQAKIGAFLLKDRIAPEETAFIADCAAYMLCAYYGIDNGPLLPTDYPQYFKKLDTAGVRNELKKMRDAFTRFHSALEQSLEKLAKERQEKAKQPREER